MIEEELNKSEESKQSETIPLSQADEIQVIEEADEEEERQLGEEKTYWESFGMMYHSLEMTATGTVDRTTYDKSMCCQRMYI